MVSVLGSILNQLIVSFDAVYGDFEQKLSSYKGVFLKTNEVWSNGKGNNLSL